MNKTTKDVFSLIWRAVILGLGSMMIGVLLVNALSIMRNFSSADYSSPIWVQAENPASTWPEYGFPLFAALYHRGMPLIWQFIWQGVSFILAVLGIMIAMKFVQESVMPFWKRLIIAPLIVFAGFISLLLQMRFYCSELLVWLLPLVILGGTALFVTLHYRAELIAVKELDLLLKKENPNTIDPGIKEAIRPIPHYNFYRGLNRTLSDLQAKPIYFFMGLAVVIFALAILSDPSFTLQHRY